MPKKKTKRRKPSNNGNPKTVKTFAALARALGVHADTARRWGKKPGFPVERDGSYDPLRVAPWVDVMRSEQANRVDTEKGTGQASKLAPQIAAAALEFKTLKNEGLRRQNDLAAGEAIPRAAVEDWQANLLAELKRNLLSVLPRNVTKSREIRAKIRAEVIAFLQAFAREPEL